MLLHYNVNAEYIHLSFSNNVINYYFCWGKFSELCKNTKSELSLCKEIGEGILAFSFIIVFTIFFQRVEDLFQKPDITLSKM